MRAPGVSRQLCGRQARLSRCRAGGENYEIAAYVSLIAAAKACGETAVVPLPEQTLAEEERMAKWIRDHLESVTATYIALRVGGASASA